MDCPKCRSDNVIELSTFTVCYDVDKATILLQCENCKCEWEEMWVFDHVFKINDVEI